MDGSGVAPEAYDAYVAHANDRDGWPRWRVADASRDRETGAPREPVKDPTPFTPEDARDFMPLVHADMDGTIDDAGRARLREIMEAHRFERLSPEARELVEGIRTGTAVRADERDAT